VVGHVDHGKSTTIGRLLYETGALANEKFSEIKAASARRGVAFEWSFLLDSLQAERDQAVTIDTTDVRFRTAARGYVIIDAPGHREFLKNMVTGAARASAALLVVDVLEGMRKQSRMHAYLLNLIGIEEIVVAVNKMDLVEYSEARYFSVCTEIRDFFATLGLKLTDIVPISARTGENLTSSQGHMPWYRGATMLDALDRLRAPETPSAMPLRIPVQDVYRFDERRIIVGRVESGIMRVGDEILFSPANEVAVVSTIVSWPAGQDIAEVHTGQVVGFTLHDEVFVERGAIVSHREARYSGWDVRAQFAARTTGSSLPRRTFRFAYSQLNGSSIPQISPRAPET
jgi:bifunctional enzyme CysN/CysC